MLRVKTKKLMLPVVSIAAAGSSQSDATAMGDDAFVTVSAADGTKGIQLPVPSDACRVCSVYNEHASNRLKVYPHSGGDINDGTADAALLVDGKTYVLFHAQDSTTWAALEVNRITSPTLVTPLLDDGDAGITLTSANQTHAAPTATVPDIGDAADTFCMIDTTQTLTNKTLTSPVIATGLTASGSAANTFAGSTGTFVTSTGANTLSGAVTINDATTPSLTTAAGKTNTGFVQINGKTSGALKLIAADSAAQTVTVTLAAQTVGAGALGIPDLAGVAQDVVMSAASQTLTNKTLTSPVLNALPKFENTVTPVAAAGTTVADAGQLASTMVNHITSDGATKGVKFPTGAQNHLMIVINDSGTAAELYAASGGTVNGLSADASVVIPASKGVLAFCTGANTWIVFDLPAKATAS